MYVRVYANLKGFQGKRQLIAFAVRYARMDFLLNFVRVVRNG